MTRDEFDTLLAAATASIPDPEERALVNAEAREFADAVDRDGKRIDYGAAVVLEGSNGVAVVPAADYATAPIYWRTVAGDLDRLLEGTELIPMLQAAAHRGPAPAA